MIIKISSWDGNLANLVVYFIAFTCASAMRMCKESVAGSNVADSLNWCNQMLAALTLF